MAMAASTSTAAADTNSNNCYDVFISHRGPDVKKTFASHLYRRLISYGLRVFLDYQELQEGEEFPGQIKGAIRTASVHIAIFSPKYAESRWCLDELVLMFESNAPIIPVFHGVKPTELRRTRGGGVYARSLHNLELKRQYDSEPRYDSDTIDKWRNALESVADISGLDLEACDGDEGELVDKVVKIVMKKCKRSQMNVAKYPMGLDEKVVDFEKKVLFQQDCGQVVGITGLGGVGKTTLAKELFNRKRSNYSQSCFLFDVRENAKMSFPSLQRKLLKGLIQSDLEIESKDEGIEILKKHMSLLSSPVLLVLDDIDDQDQVYALLPLPLPTKSLILITSRDKNVLARSGVQESSIYKLTRLNTEYSTEMFCLHAFCKPHPLSGFEILVEKFVSACDGLPLSLKVFGGLLYGNTDKAYWEDELERLEQILPDEIQNRLQISYDALQTDEKQIFLDIACFFIGENRDVAIKVWDGSGWKGSRGFQSLMNKCLVEMDTVGINCLEVETENCIRMHDHLRDLGRGLAKDSRLPYRLWHGPKNIYDLLQSSEATEVRGIRMLPWGYDYNDECASFSRCKMKKLQLLDIEVKEDLLKCILRAVVFPKLIWLRWHNCPCSVLPPCIPMKELRVLQVDGEELKTLWHEELQAPLQLRELHIDAPLLNIPKSIGQLKHLERLVVMKGNFEKLPEEFCQLPSLKHLEFRYISRLRSLPDLFGGLTNLEHIDLSYCRNLKRLPISFGSLTNLQHINFSFCNLDRLPNSFGNLIKLKCLVLRGCFNLNLSSGSFGNISTLEDIDLVGCHKIEVLPSQIVHQRSLEKLYLKLPNLKEWPSAIGESSGLERLVLETPLLETLPASLGHDLRNLKYLEMRRCRSLKRLPDSVLMLNQLTELKVEYCSLRELPFETSEVESETLSTKSGQKRCLLQLQHLELYKTKISKISFPMGICPNLKYLCIRFCEDLAEIGTLPIALIKLKLTPGLSKLKSIQGLAGLTQLRELDVTGCSELEELPCLEHLRSLQKLQATACGKLKIIQGLAGLTQLRELYVNGCSELEELAGLEHLRSLEKLWAHKCAKLKSIQGLAGLTQLRELYIYGCSQLEELAGLEHLRLLEKLSANECVKLKSIQGLAGLTQLRELYVNGCSKLEELAGLEHLRSLEKLWAHKCAKLKSIQGLAGLTQLRELCIYGCSQLEELAGLEHLRFLEKLWAHECVKLNSIQGLVGLTQLRELHLDGCVELEELPGLEHLRSLEVFRARNCVKLKSLQGLAMLTQLRVLKR